MVRNNCYQGQVCDGTSIHRPFGFAFRAAAVTVLFAAGWSGRAAILQVGPGQPFVTVCSAIGAAAAGDTILVNAAGVYKGDVCAWQINNLTIVGVGGRPKINAAGLNSQGKATWVISGNDTVIDNFEMFGAAVPDNNGAAIRFQGINLTLRNCYFHDNQDGILTNDLGGTVLVEFCEFAFNGAGDGQSHNMYINHTQKFILRYCYSHDSVVGHLVKSRATENHILYNRLSSTTGTDSYEVDLPNGGLSYLIGNLIVKGPKTENSTSVSYMEEGTNSLNPDQHLFVVNNTFVNQRGSGTFIRDVATDGTAPVLTNNIFNGPATVASGVLPVMTTNLTGSPAFANPAAFDFHLTAGSPAIDAGTNPGQGVGQPLMPGFEYVDPACAQVRYPVGTIDIGAFEFGGAGPLLDPASIWGTGGCGGPRATHRIK